MAPEVGDWLSTADEVVEAFISASYRHKRSHHEAHQYQSEVSRELRDGGCGTALLGVREVGVLHPPPSSREVYSGPRVHEADTPRYAQLSRNRSPS